VSDFIFPGVVGLTIMSSPAATSTRLSLTPKLRESIIDNNSELTPKQQVAAARAEKKKAAQDALTFKPAMVSNSAKYLPEDVSAGGVSRFDRLYGDAKARQDKADVASVRQSRDLSFKPKITARAQSRERSDSARYSESGAGRASAKTGELAKKATPSFQPEITRRASSIDRSQAQQATGERLYSVAQTLAQRQAKRKEELEKKTAKEHTFTPALNHVRSSSAMRTSVTPTEVSARQKKYEVDRAKKREELLKLKEERETKELKFKPQVNDSSLAPAPADASAVSVFERLQKAVPKELPEPVDSELTFHPKIVPYAGSDASAAASAGGKDVHSKLYEAGVQRLQQRQLESERAAQEAVAKLPFRPTLPAPAHSTLTAANVQAHKLSNDHSPSAGDGAEGSQADTMRSASTVFDRLTAGNKAQTADMLLQIKTNRELQECTFRPHIPSSSASSVSALSESQQGTIFDRLQKDAAEHQKKIERLEEEKRQQELAALKQGPSIPESSKELANQRRASTTAAGGENSPRRQSLTRRSFSRSVSPSQRQQAGTPSSPEAGGSSFPAPHPNFSFKVRVFTPDPSLFEAATIPLHKRLSRLSSTPQSPPPLRLQPSIPSASTSIAANGAPQGGIFDRLQKDAAEHQKKIGRLEEEKRQQELAMLKKGPSIPETSKELAARRKSLMTGSGQDGKGPQAPGSPKPQAASAETEPHEFVASQGEPEVPTEPAVPTPADHPAPVYEAPAEPVALAEPVIDEPAAAAPPVPPSPTAAAASQAGTDALLPTPPSQDFFPSTSSSSSPSPAPTAPTAPTLAPSSSTAGMSKVEELRARLAKQKAERERLLKTGSSAAPAEASQQDETF